MKRPRPAGGVAARAAVWLTGAALVALALASGLKKIRNPDYWWHLSTGYWIADTGSVPRVDVFTYTVPGAPWIDIHWLFQLGLAGVHALGGHAGAVAVKALLAVGLVAILATVGWRRERPWVTGLALALMLLTATERFLVRPEMVSFVLLAAVLALLERHERRGDGWIYAVVPLQVLWVNVHGLFALGIVLCGIYLVGSLVESPGGPGRRRAARRLAVVTGLSLLASLANPNFVAGARYPLEQLAMIGPLGDRGVPGRNVLELRPLWAPGVPWQRSAVPAVLLLATLAAIAASWRHDRSRLAHVLAVTAFLLLAAQAVRNLALFAIVAAPVCVVNANAWLDRHPMGAAATRIANAGVVAMLALASFDVASGRFYGRVRSVHAPGVGYVGLFVPEGAVDWIERERPPGPIAHQMACGGYVNWRLFPDYRVMVDGRLEVFGPGMLGSLAFTTPDAFRRLDSRYHFGAVLLMPLRDPPQFVAWMRRQPDWRLVHADAGGVLFVRLDGAGDARWPAVDVARPDLLPPFESEAGTVDGAHRRARARLLAGLGRVADARAERALRRLPP